GKHRPGSGLSGGAGHRVEAQHRRAGATCVHRPGIHSANGSPLPRAALPRLATGRSPRAALGSALMTEAVSDVLVIGGGINGVGIALDAAGRGLSVTLCEMNVLASATSSASSKLIHGGLRYLEQYEFRLVREALAEREILLQNAPHIVHPLRF